MKKQKNKTMCIDFDSWSNVHITVTSVEDKSVYILSVINHIVYTIGMYDVTVNKRH